MLYRGFVTNLTTYGNENSLTRIPDLLSLPSLFARLGLSSATVAISGLMYALGLGMIFKWREDLNQGLGSSLILAIIAVINPSTRVHYFVFYIPLFSFLCNYASRYGKISAWTETLAVLFLLAFTVEGIVGKSCNDTLEFWNVPTYGVLLLILIGFFRYRKLYVEAR